MMLNLKLFMLLFILTVRMTSSATPTWTAYPTDSMFSGQHSVIGYTWVADSSPDSYKNIKGPRTQTFPFQPAYDVAVNNPGTSPRFSSANTFRVVLSMMGFRQAGQTNLDQNFGFNIQISPQVTNVPGGYVAEQGFQSVVTIFGTGIYYLHYIYLAVSQSLTQYTIGVYTLNLDTTKYYKQYQITMGCQNYPTYPDNKIQMKGFLVGYSYKRKTAPGIYIDFKLKVQTASSFTINLKTYDLAELQSITFHRIAYDRTAIEKTNYKDVFLDLYLESTPADRLGGNFISTLVSNPTAFKYRNFLMGVNLIQINKAANADIEFYWFAIGFPGSSDFGPLIGAGRSDADHLYFEVFHHGKQSCASGTYYVPTTLQCEATCPSEGFIADDPSLTCLACHKSCKTCIVGYSSNDCMSCAAGYSPTKAIGPFQCTFNNPFCQKAQINADGTSTCYECLDGYRANQFGTLCYTKIYHCSIVVGKVCTLCRSGYELANGQCYQKPVDCDVMNNDGSCLQCSNNRLLTSEKNCVDSNSPFYVTCASNEYRKSDGQCYKSNFNNCARFNAQGQCLDCLQGFKFTPSLGQCRKIRQQIQICEASNDPKFIKILNVVNQCITVYIPCQGYNQDGSCYDCKDGEYSYNGHCYTYILGTNTINKNGEIIGLS